MQIKLLKLCPLLTGLSLFLVLLGLLDITLFRRYTFTWPALAGGAIFLIYGGGMMVLFRVAMDYIEEHGLKDLHDWPPRLLQNPSRHPPAAVVTRGFVSKNGPFGHRLALGSSSSSKRRRF